MPIQKAEAPLPGAAAALPTTFGPFAPGGDFATLWGAVGGGASVLNANAATIGRAAQATPATPTALTVTAAADTALPASVEASDVIFNLSATKQFATGALATQRAALIQAPTYSFVGASTITSAATVHIVGAPAAGTNATITNAAALWVQGSVAFGSNTLGANPANFLMNPAQTAAVPTTLMIVPGAGLALAASTEAADINFNCNRTVQFATGALALQRALLVQAPTYAFVGASVLAQAATVAVNAAPTAGANATLTDSYALLVQAGRVGFGGQLVGNLSGLPLGLLSYAFPTDANQVLTASQSANPILSLSGTATTTRTLTVTATAGAVYLIINSTSAAAVTLLAAAGGTGFTVANARSAWGVFNGTNFIRLSADSVLT